KCVVRVDAAIRKIAGVTDVKVDLESKSARISPSVPIDQIAVAVKSAGHYSLDGPPSEPKAKSQEPIAARTLAIKGMTCASCVTRGEQAIAGVPGVTGVVVNLAT